MIHLSNKTNLYMEVLELLTRTIEESEIHYNVSSLATSIKPNRLKPDRPEIGNYKRLANGGPVSEEMLLRMKEELEGYKDFK